MAPKDDPALGERDVAAANGGDAADGIADAEEVREMLIFSSAPLAYTAVAGGGGIPFSSVLPNLSSPKSSHNLYANRSWRP